MPIRGLSFRARLLALLVIAESGCGSLAAFRHARKPRSKKAKECISGVQTNK